MLPHDDQKELRRLRRLVKKLINEHIGSEKWVEIYNELIDEFEEDDSDAAA